MDNNEAWVKLLAQSMALLSQLLGGRDDAKIEAEIDRIEKEMDKLDEQGTKED